MEIILNKNIDNNTNGIYLRHLIDQYMDATGIKCLPTNNERLKKEITEWLKERDSLTDTYKMLLDVELDQIRAMKELKKYNANIQRIEFILKTKYNNQYLNKYKKPY